MLYGKIPKETNDKLLALGMVSSASLPMIGVFDENAYHTFHITFAVLYFGGAGLYIFNLARVMKKYRQEFPPEEQGNITNILNISYSMVSSVILLLLSWTKFFGLYQIPVLDLTTPALEWTTVLIIINFFGLQSMLNPYYDSIHPYGVLVSPPNLQ